MTTTTRALRDSLANAFDYLMDAELALYVNEVAIDGARVSWHPLDPAAEFIITRGYATPKQYIAWVKAGAYSAILFDASLLQLTYEVEGGAVTRHRLAYIPCPFLVDDDLLQEGEPIADVVELYSESMDAIALRSPVRFDYDRAAAKPGHPAAHLTINSSDCRIACVAPMHASRFLDFVFRHFYPQLRAGHEPFFSECAKRHLGARVISDEDCEGPHLMWRLHSISG